MVILLETETVWYRMHKSKQEHEHTSNECEKILFYVA